MDEDVNSKCPALDDGQGRQAEKPSSIPARGFLDVLRRIAGAWTEDRISLVAAGVTYYLLLAVFPALAVLVSLYGFISDPSDIADQIDFLSAVVPAGMLDLITRQLHALAGENTSATGFAFFGGLLVAFWSANNGIKALFEAMNVAYGETEKRSFIRLNLITFGFTLGALVVLIILITGIAVVPAAVSLIGPAGWIDEAVRLARWPIVLAVIAVGISLLYRFGPSREQAKLRWLSWGAVFSVAVWLLSSVLFSYYLENYGNYNATYGTLGALIGSVAWIWLSMIILIVGAKLNAELEHQTAIDSTIGEPQPMGQRGAHVADTLGATRR
ncbi:YihY/virulence factor BrkB family protein [Rhizobium sp. L1K21]|nr:YihY/virulence factor BrkB family protein [Rhizobium sp. L1K21]